MKVKEKTSQFSIVETPCTELDLGDTGSPVYSVLALQRDDDTVSSRFVYDVSRDRCKAEYLLSSLKYIRPSGDEIFDFISEML